MRSAASKSSGCLVTQAAISLSLLLACLTQEEMPAADILRCEGDVGDFHTGETWPCADLYVEVHALM